MNAAGWRCATCGTTLGIDTVMPWRCPRSTRTDRHHVLEVVRREIGLDRRGAVLDRRDAGHPFLAFDGELAWSAFADVHGMDRGLRDALVQALDRALVQVDGTGFVATPFSRHGAVSEALGFRSAGGVWVKDETGNVAGSHKARHLVTILLHLLAAESLGLLPWAGVSRRPPLAISSCGNAALAAATLAAAASWPLTVFVPPWADPAIVSRLEQLGANVETCPRRPGDPPGDPCMHRFRDAVDAGAVPFSVQGPENALCLDGGRTLGWEMAVALDEAGEAPLDRVFVQVGGGAFAASTGDALHAAGHPSAVHAVQAEGCAPLARAWDRASGLPGGVATAAHHWSSCMWPWGDEPTSVADGILDDETYDWWGVVRAMWRSGGSPVVAPEHLVVEAHRLASSVTEIPVSATGSAGLAGLLTMRDQVGDDERVAVVFSGVQR